MTTSPYLSTPRARFHRLQAATSPVNRRRRSEPVAAQPLYEALAIGLGCVSFDHDMTASPEWR